MREYVVVDRFKRQALVMSWQQDDYAEHILNPSDTYESPLLPGLSVPMNEVFAEFAQ